MLLSLSVIISCSSEPDTVLYTLNVSINPTDGGTVSPSSGEFEEGSSVTINATPNTGYQFDSWSGNASGSESPFLFYAMLVFLFDGYQSGKISSALARA